MLPPHLPNSTVPLPSPYGPMLFRVTDHAREQDYLHEIAGGAPFPLNFPSQGPLPTSFYNLGLPTMGPSLPFFFPPPPEAFIRLQIAQHVGIIGPNPKQLTAEYFQSLEVGQQMAMLVYILSPPPPAPSSQQGAETTPGAAAFNQTGAGGGAMPPESDAAGPDNEGPDDEEGAEPHPEGDGTHKRHRKTCAQGRASRAKDPAHPHQNMGGRPRLPIAALSKNAGNMRRRVKEGGDALL